MEGEGIVGVKAKYLKQKFQKEFTFWYKNGDS